MDDYGSMWDMQICTVMIFFHPVYGLRKVRFVDRTQQADYEDIQDR